MLIRKIRKNIRKEAYLIALYLARGLPVTVGVGATQRIEDIETTHVIPLFGKSERCDPFHGLESILDYQMRVCHRL